MLHRELWHQLKSATACLLHNGFTIHSILLVYSFLYSNLNAVLNKNILCLVNKTYTLKLLFLLKKKDNTDAMHFNSLHKFNIHLKILYTM